MAHHNIWAGNERPPEQHMQTLLHWERLIETLWATECTHIIHTQTCPSHPHITNVNVTERCNLLLPGSVDGTATLRNILEKESVTSQRAKHRAQKMQQQLLYDGQQSQEHDDAGGADRLALEGALKWQIVRRHMHEKYQQHWKILLTFRYRSHPQTALIEHSDL